MLRAVRHSLSLFVLAIAMQSLSPAPAHAQKVPLRYDDKDKQLYQLTARASEIDSRAKEHPEIGFVFEKDGKVQDLQHATVNTKIRSRGKLVIWLMGHNEALFDRLASYGLHAIQVHYANKWFGTVCQENPVGEMCRGDVRLEAATGEDHSDQVSIPKPDGMKERAYQFVRWLAKKHPQGGWEYYLDAEKQELNWDDVIMAGSSHGSTTSARFAVHQKVSRVVMFSGPRDQLQTWQKLPSATPTNRYYGFTHILDSGWTADHYCRSWELLGMNQYGPIVDVDRSRPPYQNTRCLITDIDVGGNAKRAHGASVPGRSAAKTKKGSFVHERVWRYLFTHPVDETGDPVPHDQSCNLDQRK